MFWKPRKRAAEATTATMPRRLRELEIITARLIRAGFAGQYQAAFLGRGIEFFQVREYQPGDDVRTIDWNVTARSGVPHVKQFVEERDLTVVVAVDLSGSMRFGSLSRRKIDVAVELAAVLSFAALQNNDRIGVLLYSDDVVRYLPPRRGRHHARTVVRTLLDASSSATGAANPDAAADFLDRVLVKRAVVIALSDFIGKPPDTALRQLTRRHDVVAIRVLDPRESRLPSRGIVSLRDAETSQRIDVDLSRARPSGIDGGLVPFEERMRGLGIDSLVVTTTIPYDRSLIRFFGARRGRVRDGRSAGGIRAAL